HQYPCHNRIDPAQQMPCWNAPFEVEQLKQLALITSLLTHHSKPPQPNPSSRRNHCSPKIASPFSTPSTRFGCWFRSRSSFGTIGQNQPLGPWRDNDGYAELHFGTIGPFRRDCGVVVCCSARPGEGPSSHFDVTRPSPAIPDRHRGFG